MRSEVGGKVGENLRASLAMLPLSKQLTTIKCDVHLSVGIDQLIPDPVDVERLRQLFEQYEFRPWLEELPKGDEIGGIDANQAPAGQNYETILDWDALDEWIAHIRAAGRLSLDTETTGPDYMQSQLVGISFATEPGRAAYIPVGHAYPEVPEQLPRDEVIARLKPLLEDRALRKIGQNPKFDKNVLKSYDVELEGIAFDTMLESYVLDSVGSRHDMADLAQRHLGIKTSSFEDVAGKGAKQSTFDAVPIDRATQYAAEDADVTLRLHEVLWPKLVAEPKLRSVFEDIEMPLVGVLSRMERTGAKVDGKLLMAQSGELSKRISDLALEAFALAGEEFNLDSPKQLQAILHDKLGLPVLRKTPGGQPSTAEPVLAELALDYPLPRVIMDYRSLTKLKSTYTDKLPLQINPRTGRIHTSYHQAVAATGRLSSADPNLQNIPVRTAEGRRIRQAFVAPAWTNACRSGLFADRASDHGAPFRRCWAATCIFRRARRSSRDRRGGIRASARLRHRRSTPQREGNQLWLDLRHVGIRTRSPVGCRSSGRERIHRAIFRALSGCAPLHGQRARGRGGARLCRDRLWPEAVSAGNQRGQWDAASGCGAHRDQRADAGNGSRHHQTRDDRRRSLARKKRRSARR